jgi:hypothetical protein
MSKMRISILAAAFVAVGTAIGVVVAARSAHAPSRASAAPPSPAWLAKHAVRLHKAAGPSTAESGGEGPIDWNRPFVDDEGVAGVGAAAARLTFAPAAPAAVGRPTSVVVHRAFRPQAVGLIYDSATYGHFYVIEEPSKMTVADLQRLVDRCNPATGCQGTWRMIQLSDGTPALLVSPSDEATTIGWIRHGIEYIISGPPQTLSGDAATKLADFFAAASA